MIHTGIDVPGMVSLKATQDFSKRRNFLLAARGAFFEKTAPLDPPQKLFINILLHYRILLSYICNL
jgi:hypothetical protein